MHMLERRNDIQKGLDRLESWAHMNLTKLNKAKCGRSCIEAGSIPSTKTGRAEIKTSCGKKDLVGVVDEKLNLTWQWEIIAQKAYHILDCSERRDQQVEGGDFSPLLL